MSGPDSPLKVVAQRSGDDDVRDAWAAQYAAAARRAVLDTYRRYLTELGGNETLAAELTRAWANLVKRDIPGMPPAVYTAASLRRWADRQRQTSDEDV